jgi:hypothetical protein
LSGKRKLQGDFLAMIPSLKAMIYTRMGRKNVNAQPMKPKIPKKRAGIVNSNINQERRVDRDI